MAAVETYNQSNKPKNSIKQYRVELTASKKRAGWTDENSKMYYEVDKFDRTIVLYFSTKYDGLDGPEIVRWNQYANHYGGEFTVSKEQKRKFENMLKVVKRKEIKKK